MVGWEQTFNSGLYDSTKHDLIFEWNERMLAE
jgi:hypothetical protein